MQTRDGRRIISGFYTTETERKECLTSMQWTKWKELERIISDRDTGTKAIIIGVNRNQQSIIGSPGDVNPWGHSEGTIGNTIDYCVQLGVFTKKQIMILAGTKMAKINSHFRSMAIKEEYFAIKNSDGTISFRK